MLLDAIHGTIDRRILLNYRIDPAALRAVLPPGFRPKCIAGVGIGGVCLIRFARLRPRHVPGWLGLASENAAHRIAVEWDQDGEAREGVFIPRRDTNSRFNRVLGGRVFPGLFSTARFETRESASSLAVTIVRPDGGVEVAFAGRTADALRPGSVFASVGEAARFFSLGATGYSATRQPARFHGMELHARDWTVEPLAIDEARSAFFDDPARFPPGTVALDCALLMRGIEHDWHSRPDLYLKAGDTSFTTTPIR